MILKKLKITRSPGLGKGFDLPELEEGLIVIHGPNGSGKSTIGRLIAATLWPGKGDLPIDIEAEWRIARQEVRSVYRDRRIKWEKQGKEAPRPPLPEDRFASCFRIEMRDLLAVSDKTSTDQQLALEIRKQFTGGFDLDGLRERNFRVGSNFAAAQKKVLDAAKERCEEVRKKEAEIARNRMALRSLIEERAGIEKSLEELEPLRNASSRLKLKAQQKQLAAVLGEFPEGMSTLDADDLKTLKGLEESVASVEKVIQACEEEIRQAESQKTECGLGQSIDASTLQSAHGYLSELKTLEAELRTALKDSERAARTYALALSHWGTESAENRAVNNQDLLVLSAHFSEYTAVVTRLQAIDAEKALLNVSPSAYGRDEVMIAAQAMRSWLALRTFEPGSTFSPAWIRLIPVAAIALAVLVYLLASGLLWLAAVLAGVGIGALIALGAARKPKAHEAQFAHFRQTVESTKIPPPARWDKEEVTRALRNLDEEWKNTIRQEEFQSRLERLDSEERTWATKKAQLDQKRESLCSTYGIDFRHNPALNLVLERLAVLQKARLERESREADLEVLQKRHVTLLDELNRFFSKQGSSAAKDATSAEALLDDLESRSVTLRSATATIATATGRKEIQLAELVKRREALEAFWVKRSIESGNSRELSNRLERLPEFLMHAENSRKCAYELERAEKELSGRMDLLTMSEEEIQLKLGDSDLLKEALESLRNRIIAIEHAIREVQSNHSYEKAQAEVEFAHSDLNREEERALDLTTGDFLLGKVQQAYEQASRPEVLTRACSYFEQFTQGRYRLELLTEEGSPEFKIKDHSTDDWKSLSDLSAGTRIQLLLAARVAFAQSLEKDEPLPIFLDEVLANTDPVRFRAVAGSIGRLLKQQGRQVFYMTSNPADFEAWQEYLKDAGAPAPQEVDLARIRALQEADDRLVARPRQVRRMPRPDGMSRDEYARLLAVPPINLWQSAEELHLFYLIPDDLQLLHSLVDHGIEQAGQWEIVCNSLPDGLCPEEQARKLSAAWEVARDVFSSWRKGRGRKLSPDVIEKVDLTDLALESARSLAEKCNWEARRLMKALDDRTDPHAKSIRKPQIDKLKAYLQEQQYVDGEEPMTEATILALVCREARERNCPMGFDEIAALARTILGASDPQ